MQKPKGGNGPRVLEAQNEAIVATAEGTGGGHGGEGHMCCQGLDHESDGMMFGFYP